jgi:hypothetical protein
MEARGDERRSVVAFHVHQRKDYSANNWSHRNSNKRIKEKFGSHTRKTFNTFTTKDSCTWNMTLNMESTAVRNLKPERWGSPLMQEKYQGEKACDKRQEQNNLIIILISLNFKKILCSSRISE